MIDLFTYAVISLVYIMIMHFAVGIEGDFKIHIMLTIFIVGAAMGAYIHSYEFGLGVAILLSLITW